MNIDDFDLAPEQIIEAISKGVERAIWRIATNATSAPCADFYESIKCGIKEAIKEGCEYPWNKP